MSRVCPSCGRHASLDCPDQYHRSDLPANGVFRGVLWMLAIEGLVAIFLLWLILAAVE